MRATDGGDVWLDKQLVWPCPSCPSSRFASDSKLQKLFREANQYGHTK